jgi:hypothetical protein
MADDESKEVSTAEPAVFPLWSDDPAEVDLLAFSAISGTIVDALLDEELDPLAIGLSGSWGSGKTTVLRLVGQELNAQTTPERAVLVVSTDPWRYDPMTGVKETLIGEVLAALKNHLDASRDTKGKALEQLGSLAKRVDWARAVRIAAKGTLAFQVPSFDDVVQIVRPKEDEPPPGLDAFREEFQALMESDDLGHVRRLVVLVDDLDRCLDETIVDTLEAIRLFLAVPKMSFVLAADEDRVADALRSRFGEATGAGEDQPEEPAKLYLHKIVQTTVPIPALSRFDTEAYLILLQILTGLDDERQKACIDLCEELRRTSGELDDLAKAAAKDISSELLFAARLTPILYEKLRGNPRRIKRFLNDLNVRQSIATRRGIDLEPEVIAKLMVLEVLLPDAFAKVLSWLAQNALRDQIGALEAAAGRPAPDEIGGDSKKATSRAAKKNADAEAEEFDEDLLRWAKLPPALAGIDLGPYLHLAAAFTGRALLDEGLPAHLRDLAANLVSSVRAEQKAVTDEDLQALSQPDALVLAKHLARVARDRPTEQVAAIIGFLRITRLHPSVEAEAAELLRAIPGNEVEPATALHFQTADLDVFEPVLERWQKQAPAQTKSAITRVLDRRTA